MIMWVRDRARTLAPNASGRADAVAVSAADPTMQRPTKRVAAISSSSIDASTAPEASAGNQIVTTRAASSPRRPGVEARWKEQNRVPYPRSL